VGRPPVTARTLLCAVAGLLLSTTAPADGKYWPEAAYEEDVRIPSQRALIRFKDGKETLIIESSAESDSKGLGWVIPLPAVPGKMEVVRPGLFESLSFCLRARITHYEPRRDFGTEMAFFLFLLAALWTLLGFARKPLRIGIGCSTSFLLFVGFVVVVCLPRVGCSARQPGAASAVAGITIKAAKRVGSYDVTVLSAEAPGALGEWLETNGFAALGDEDRAVVADYIAKKWCFFAAKLAREEGGEAIPHPIAFEFPSKEAIYPLRLTGLTASEPYFEVFAVGEKQAVFPDLHTALADRFKGPDGRGYWKAEHDYVLIGHPEIRKYFWDGCVVTRFTGTLTAEQMREDVTLGWKGLWSHRDHFYGRRAARRIGLALSFLLASVLFLVIAAFLAEDFRKGGRRARVLVAMVSVLVVSRVAGMIVTASLPTVEIRTEEWHHRRVLRAILGEVAFSCETEKVRDAAHLRKIIGEVTERHGLPRNGYLGGGMREEASPGNYEIREEEGEARLYGYDEHARPELVWPPAARTPSPPSP